jgi:hypothetical protein
MPQTCTRGVTVNASTQKPLRRIELQMRTLHFRYKHKPHELRFRRSLSTDNARALGLCHDLENRSLDGAVHPQKRLCCVAYNLRLVSPESRDIAQLLRSNCRKALDRHITVAN